LWHFRRKRPRVDPRSFPFAGPPPGKKFALKEMAILARTIGEPEFGPFEVEPASRFRRNEIFYTRLSRDQPRQIERRWRCRFARALAGVARVARIERHTIDADVTTEAVAFHLLLGAVVATLAQRLERAELEQDAITLMRHNVIDHVRHHIAALRETEAAERLTQ
jgi:hypothetical protein